MEWAAALSLEPNHVDLGELLAATKEVLAAPVDLFLATTGVGMKTWLDAATDAGLYDDLVAALGASEILARGPKSVGVLRATASASCGRRSRSASRTCSPTCAAAT